MHSCVCVTGTAAEKNADFYHSCRNENSKRINKFGIFCLFFIHPFKEQSVLLPKKNVGVFFQNVYYRNLFILFADYFMTNISELFEEFFYFQICPKKFTLKAITFFGKVELIKIIIFTKKNVASVLGLTKLKNAIKEMSVGIFCPSLSWG